MRRRTWKTPAMAPDTPPPRAFFAALSKICWLVSATAPAGTLPPAAAATGPACNSSAKPETSMSAAMTRSSSSESSSAAGLTASAPPCTCGLLSDFTAAVSNPSGSQCTTPESCGSTARGADLRERGRGAAAKEANASTEAARKTAANRRTARRMDGTTRKLPGKSVTISTNSGKCY